MPRRTFVIQILVQRSHKRGWDGSVRREQMGQYKVSEWTLSGGD